jgi:hypothetical protein
VQCTVTAVYLSFCAGETALYCECFTYHYSLSVVLETESTAAVQQRVYYQRLHAQRVAALSMFNCSVRQAVQCGLFIVLSSTALIKAALCKANHWCLQRQMSANEATNCVTSDHHL